MNRYLELRASLSIAAIYGYFLIFAQFSWVELLRAQGIAVRMEKAVLGAMAVAGIAAGFLIAWRGVSPRPVRIALVVAAVAAGAAPLASDMVGFFVIAVATGAALGVATVGLSALLPGWCGLMGIGVGTGLGYALCNLPAVFQQLPAGQAWIGVGMAVAGVILLPAEDKSSRPVLRHPPFPFWAAVLVFTVLVWMDSAAFFIIQHSGDLKAGTWGGPLLWRNALVHFGFACAAGAWLSRGGGRWLPGIAWGVLAVAALMVNDAATRPVAGWLYPAGVSLYSAALVAWPGWFAGAGGTRAAAWRAAWLFAIAGWFGSANGIGMAETLKRVPTSFVAGAGLIVAAVLCLQQPARWRVALGVGTVLLMAWIGAQPDDAAPSASAARGRQVYLAEGCIHCHSQYVRPKSIDEAIWGPAPEMEKVLDEEPVLIGNRRQGPDLTNVGARRSAAWLKAHFINPQALAPDSSMPSYAYLFEDRQGDDLVRYLSESGREDVTSLLERQTRWEPKGSPGGHAAPALYAAHCAACHGTDGHGGGPVASQLPLPPLDLRQGPFVRTADGDTTGIARIIKFGVLGSHMPGHETLEDGEIIALAEMLVAWRK